ncbi:MAG: hypothetical protein ACI9JM_002040 [Halioglobus sp.]|jgi:hypothetical protein
MISSLSKTLFIPAAFCLLAGCKLALMVPTGGEVTSSSTTRNCNGGSGGKFCTFDLSSVPLPFSETFTATVTPGYQFVKWQDGDDFKCAGSTNPVCTVSIADDIFGVVSLATYETAYLMAVFKDVGFDTDGDGIFDRQDEDDDNDGIPDGDDPCPLALVCGEVSIEQLVLNECTVTGEEVFQTFTATQTGDLSAISFAVESSFLDQLVTHVYEGVDQTGTQLYSGFGVMDSGPATALRSINFGTAPVTAGQVYTIGLFAGTGMSWSVCGSSLNQYPDGEASGNTLGVGWDLGFSLTIDY